MWDQPAGPANPEGDRSAGNRKTVTEAKYRVQGVYTKQAVVYNELA